MREQHDWEKNLDERQRNEVEFAQVYAASFAHGTDGHTRLLLLAKMAALLNEYEKRIKELESA